MFENIPTDLMERFNSLYKNGNILCFKTQEGNNVKTETIYYKYCNALGTLRKITDVKRNTSFISDNYLLIADISVLLEESKI